MTECKTAKLGFYEILRPLATGGMAELFLARSTGPQGFEKLVVLKKLLPELADDARCVGAFIAEAKLVAHLDHPHIAQVHDLLLLDGHYAFAMEYVRGRDLRTILHAGADPGAPVPLEHAIQIAQAIASALHYAHERRDSDGRPLGIVHRDVSPENIRISNDGVVKLLDFGVAKATTSTIQTRVGTIKGKPAYMAPEQRPGAVIDRRVDVYALGVVLAEMLIGQRIHDSEIGVDDPRTVPPSRWRRDCPPELDAIVLRALASKPGSRYQTAQELQIDLEELARVYRLGHSRIALARALCAAAAGTTAAGDAAMATVGETAMITVGDRVSHSSFRQEEPTRQYGFQREEPTRAYTFPPEEPTRRDPTRVAQMLGVPREAETNVYRTTAQMAASKRHGTTFAAITAIGVVLLGLIVSAALAMGDRGRHHTTDAEPVIAPSTPARIEPAPTARSTPPPRSHARGRNKKLPAHTAR